MKRFVYDEIRTRETRIEKVYECPNGEESYDLITALDKAGECGWELVGELEGRIILKNQV